MHLHRLDLGIGVLHALRAFFTLGQALFLLTAKARQLGLRLQRMCQRLALLLEIALTFIKKSLEFIKLKILRGILQGRKALGERVEGLLACITSRIVLT